MDSSEKFSDDCLPPEGQYPTREALYNAINAWAAPQGYAFITGKSTAQKNGTRVVWFACDRSCSPPDPSRIRKRKTSTRGTGCQFSILAKESRENTWTVKHRPDNKFAVHNHSPSWDRAAHPVHRKIPDSDRETIRRLTIAGALPKDIRSYLRENSDGIATQQDVYNCMAEIRRELAVTNKITSAGIDPFRHYIVPRSFMKDSVQHPFIVSAPGKAIIFGEHAVVYNKPAIAAALSLRTYFLAAENTDPSLITLDFPDIQFSHSWSISEFPWKKKRTHKSDELDLELVDSLSGMLLPLKNPLHHSAAFAFLYLYLSLANDSMVGRRFCVRSTLPIGAGLGSSASISVCIAACLGVLAGHISPAALDLDQEVSSRSEECAFIDKWSFMGEKCIHGNPSGIDNAVATEGGAVMFQRNEHSMPSVRTSMRNFPPLRLLLTNTNVARRTAVLVGNVSRLVTTYPKTSGSILDAIDSLTKEAYNIMVRPFFNADSKATLSELIRINHGLLVSLGVSHPSLEKIKLLADELNVGDTKLTGAGGGGCAITLVKDDVEESTLKGLVNSFDKEGFECFETLLGGKGCGMLKLDQELAPEKFIALSGREQIERMVGVGHAKGWKFW